MKTREELEKFISNCHTDVLKRANNDPILDATDPVMRKQNALCQELIAIELQRRNATESITGSKIG